MESLMWCIKQIIGKSVMALAIALCLCAPYGFTQTFSNRSSDDLLSVYLSVLNQPFGYQTIGVRIDTNDGYHFSTIIRNFNFEGAVIDTKVLYFPDKIYNPSRDNNTRLNDSTTVTAVVEQFENNEINYSTVVWMNNFGDTLFTKRFISPYYEEGVNQTNFILPTTIICSPDGQFIYFVAQIFHSSSQNNFLIKKLTSQGDEVWTYVNELDNSYQYCSTIQFYDDNLWFVVQGWGTNAYNKLIELNDSTNEILQEIELIPEDNLLYYAEEMYMDEEGVIVACIEFGGQSVYKPSVYKMDYGGALLWNATPDGEFAATQYNNHLVKSQDGGYVSCSVKYEEQINPNDPNDPSANNTNEKIWLWKVDNEGVFLWQRFYEYLTFDSGYFYLNNTANDLKPTPDGGYIMAGQATANCLEWPCLAGDPFTQQGWLLKVDGCGCLVPGCDEECTVVVSENGKEKLNHFKFGPNPVRDNLNVYIPKSPSHDSADLKLLLCNAQGQFIKSLTLKHDNTTYVIDSSSLSAGLYLISLMDGNVVLQTEQLVVER